MRSNAEGRSCSPEAQRAPRVRPGDVYADEAGRHRVIIHPMLERFSEPARRAIARAQDEARVLGHQAVAPEHLVLALLTADTGLGGSLARALRSPARTGGPLDIDDLRERLARTLGAADPAAPDPPPFSPATRDVLERAFREALRLRHAAIEPEHLLLALARSGELGDLLAAERGLRPIETQAAVINLLAGNAPSSWIAGSGPLSPAQLAAAELFGALGRARSIADRDDAPVDVGHVLLGMAAVPDGLVARALSRLGVHSDALWEAVRRAREQGTEP